MKTAELERPIRTYLDDLSSSVVAVTRLPPTGASLHLRLGDGTELKLTESVAGKPARSAGALRALQMDCFPPVLAFGTKTLLTRWIPGEPLEGRATVADVEHCGVLHARLHNRPTPPGAQPRRTVPAWREWLQDRSRELATAGVVDAAVAAAVVERALEAGPTTGCCSWIHRDFCAENIVCGDDGALHVIDNESIELGVPEYDLARTWARWDMSAEWWHRYLAAYSRERSTERFLDELPFWQATALLGSVYYRWRNELPGLDPVLERWTALDYERSGLRVRIFCEDAADRAWLDDFLSPWFAARREGRGPLAEAEVRLVRDRSQSEDVCERCVGDDPTTAFRCFTLDGGFVELPGCFGPPGPLGLSVYDTKFGAALLFDGPGNLATGEVRDRVRIVGAPGNRRARLTAMRVVREYLHQHLRRLQAPVLHAAAMELDGQVAALVGPKQCGKTTLLSWCLESASRSGTPVRMVANDRVELVARLGGIEARGVPTIVSIRPGSAQRVPSIGRARSRGLVPAANRRDETSELSTFRADRTLHVAPGELCRLLGCETSIGGRLAVVFLLARGGSGPEIDVERVDPAVALDRLRDGLIGAAGEPGELPSTLFVPRPTAENEPDRVSLAEVARQVPVFALRVGAEAFQQERGPQPILDLLRDPERAS